MIAHIYNNVEQSLRDHSRNTADLTGKKLSALGLTDIGMLAGLLHDLGKGTTRFDAYIRQNNFRKGDVHHAPSGAIFVYERWYKKASSPYDRLTAQIVSMVIYGHHSGFMDVISPDGCNVLSESLAQSKDSLGYNEAVENFTREVASEAELDELFQRAVDEVSLFVAKLKIACSQEHRVIFLNLLMRLVLSALVDSDRLDSACFEYGVDPFDCRPTPDWNAALASLESVLATISGDSTISAVRQKISDECLAAAEKEGRIFRLTVPTGGGKTFSSLRFALKRALNGKIKHIYYVIPYNTILDQNARDIREALGKTVDILEHHSNVVFDADDEDMASRYVRLTERWDADIILTSMVQFMNSLFSGGNSDTRRMSALANSVIIFDEIQSLPITCRVLFECAVEFLATICGCTVLLCTATQPQLRFSEEPIEIINNPDRLFASMERVRFHDETKVCMSAERAADRLVELTENHGAVLMIVNTKQMAKRIYELMREYVPCVHLSTGMYPAHRLELIDKIKKRDPSKPLFCVSTSLIEAGVNISFPCVVRSLASLGSILQAAGRCNRNCEASMGDVYIWQLNEDLGKLPQIRAAAEITKGLLVSGNIGSLSTIERYFETERRKLPELIDKYSSKKIVNCQALEEFPLPEINNTATIFALLGKRGTFGKSTFPLDGAYRTAGKYFRVIESSTHSVLVPKGRGAEISSLLCKNTSYDETKRLLREAGRYCVSLYDGMFVHLRDDEKALIFLENVGIYVLRDGWYDENTGIMFSPGKMSLLEY